jgi:hypothetical protein
MTDRIKFGGESVVFIEETFGGLDSAELTVKRDEFGEYELHFDVEGKVDLEEFITALESDKVEIDVSHFRTSSIEIHKTGTETEHDDVQELTQSLAETQRMNMPPVPEDTGLKTTTDDDHYRRLVQTPDSQPAKYRRLIRNEGKIARPKLDRWAERQGFEPETGGSHNASLLMLERIGEIERRGRGDDQTIVWVGE